MQKLSTIGGGAVYDPVADRWTSISNVGAPSPRHGASIAWTGEYVVIVGGSGPSCDTVCTDGAVYQLGTDEWLPLTESDDAFSFGAAFWTGNEMSIWGAPNGELPTNRGFKLSMR